MNNLSLISVAELLDGRYFFIPAYQRGYRWGKNQMWELLDDLFEFAIRPKKQGEFYCLQPVIVRPVTDDSKLAEIKEITQWDDRLNATNTWEVVDGQQRLTSLYIIFRYLIDAGAFPKNLSQKIQDNLYGLCYETRPESKEFLESLDGDHLKDDNIDLSYISKAYESIGKWVEERGYKLAKRAGRRADEDDILTVLANILRNTRTDINEAEGSAQFIWYELKSTGANPIDEFLNINNGKIRLTDAELIKGLFLQKRNFIGDSTGEQMKIAMQWESIENTLHQDDFWSFLSDNEDSDNRIELLFSLLYQQDRNGELPKDGNLFRHFFSLFYEIQSEDLKRNVEQLWERVLQLFRVLEGWYENPVSYNTIGFLIHSGVSLHQIVSLYNSTDANADKVEFYAEINKLIANQLPAKKLIEKDEIPYVYDRSSDKTKIRSLLLFLNIYLLNRQMAKLREKSAAFMTPAYKFPFDLYVEQKWDVEHIDSATMNSLKDEKDKKQMIEEAITFLRLENDPDITDALKGDKPNYSKAWELILQKDGGIGRDDQLKDEIGNLTLLDAETNRGYKNRVFARKRKYIQMRIQEGTFVPLCTQMVFNKGFEQQNTDFRIWSDTDKNLYTQFIIKQLKEFYGINDSKEVTKVKDVEPSTDSTVESLPSEPTDIEQP